MKLSIIAALGKNQEIGLENDLLWHISEDLKRFKQITSGHTVIMGRLTFESIGSRPLPKRRNIIISSKPELLHEKVEMAQSVDHAIQLVENEDEVFVLGGATIYKQVLPFSSRMYLTHVHKEFVADTFFPPFNLEEWKIIEQVEVVDDSQAGVNYSFLTYDRKP